MNRAALLAATLPGPPFGPPPGSAVPAGFTRLRTALDRGLPLRIALDARLALVLAFPGGDVRGLLDLPAETPIGTAATAADSHRLARLYLLRDATPLAALPLLRGRRLLPASGTALLELLLLDWRITAGTAVGPGAHGAFLDLAWRPVVSGAPLFALPRARTAVRTRLAGAVVDGSTPQASPAAGGLAWRLLDARG